MKLYTVHMGDVGEFAESADVFKVGATPIDGEENEEIEVCERSRMVFPDTFMGMTHAFAHEIWREIAVRKYLGWPIPIQREYDPITLDECDDPYNTNHLERLVKATRALYGDDFAREQAEVFKLL